MRATSWSDSARPPRVGLSVMSGTIGETSRVGHMAQDHWIDGFNFNVEEWAPTGSYETLAISRTLAIARGLQGGNSGEARQSVYDPDAESKRVERQATPLRAVHDVRTQGRDVETSELVRRATRMATVSAEGMSAFVPKRPDLVPFSSDVMRYISFTPAGQR